MSTLIRRCPFCGSNAHVVEIQSGKVVTDYSISCNDIFDCIAGVPMQYYKTQGEAIHAWNRRAMPLAEAATPADEPNTRPSPEMGA